jgi:MFS family permease
MAGPTLAAFRVPGYPALWLAGTAAGLGWSVSLVAIAWVTLEVSDSPFAVGATFAARLLPALLFGIPLGGLVDRFDRRTTLVLVNGAGAAGLIFIGALGAAGGLGIAELVVLSFALGITDTLRGTAYQSYVVDLAGPAGATNAIALSNLGGQLASVIGSIAGGVVLERTGVPPTFVLAGALAAVAAVGLALTGRHTRREPAAPRLTPSFRSSMTLIVRNRAVTLIAIVVIINEMLGFASITLFPTFARDVLHTDAAGLGALSSARAIGGMVGLLVLARLGARGRSGRLFIAATLLSGTSLFLFALSTTFALSLALLFVVGIAWAACDTLGQSSIQRVVDDHERGAAMGIWFFGIGFGPFGDLVLSGAATIVGAPLAQGVDGALLALAAIGFFTIRTLRRLP